METRVEINQNQGPFARMIAAFERFCASRVRCFVASLLFTGVVFALCALAFKPHGVNDDWAISNALSGTWAEPQGLTLFVNALLCRLVVFLNTHIPQFNWFAVLEFLTAYLSYLALTYLSLTRLRPEFGALVVAGFTLLVLPGCTWLANFTYAAFAGCCAGGMCLMASLAEKRHKAHLVVLGVLFFCMGILWRANMFFISIPIFGLAALFLVVQNAAQGGARGVLGQALRLWPFVIVLALFGGIMAYHSVAWSDQVWDDWYQYNEIRSVFSDYPHKDYDEVAEELTAIGVSENDYDAVCSWVTEDPDFFTAQRMESITDIATTTTTITVPKIGHTVLRYGYRLLTNKELIPLVVLLVLAACIALKGRTRWFALSLIACACALGVVFLLIGRLPDRVHYPLWIYTFAAVGCVAPRMLKQQAIGKELDADQKPESTGRPIIACANALAPVVTAVLVLSTAVPLACPARIMSALDAQGFTAQSQFLDYVDEHPDNVFIVNMSSNFDIVYAHYMLAPVQASRNDRIIGLGGWAARSPYSMARNANAGMKNPVKGLVENENALYVASKTTTADILKTYLREHYYPDATYAKVGEVADWNGKGTLALYKFSDR